VQGGEKELHNDKQDEGRSAPGSREPLSREDAETIAQYIRGGNLTLDATKAVYAALDANETGTEGSGSKPAAPLAKEGTE